MKKLLPVLLVIFGLVGGAGAGLLLQPKPAACPASDAEQTESATRQPLTADAACATDAGTGAATSPAYPPAASPPVAAEYVRLERQFVIPVISPDRVRALVVISLSIETDSGAAAQVYAQEPKLRDAFLQVLFRHANSGGFDGAFTTGQPMEDLRGGLRSASRDVLGALSRDVLVVDVVRQDI
ncbi:flagellar basal body-associated FliL family protein [Abyssibius alkaniclasticus]|uniref:flagellar basal body-associated FliL family protein n=1 Tax=Abyssibius alkaniclasticus TaxID=2881234 RepID=UPI002364042E|nr:flagellar basal body-associated FliL family protein [Abyssibius alkaniclasticus]UPH71833.1 flagellar basal body-associated FliL family protein [Abyssibius alkaniclasticus]|tara:strand:+ start:26 stop:574 length:549 start_codon:yes stop_codon:yes gene_type:complete